MILQTYFSYVINISYIIAMITVIWQSYQRKKLSIKDTNEKKRKDGLTIVDLSISPVVKRYNSFAFESFIILERRGVHQFDRAFEDKAFCLYDNIQQRSHMESRLSGESDEMLLPVHVCSNCDFSLTRAN